METAGVSKANQSLALLNNGVSASAINAARGIDSDTIATTANTAAKQANLSVTNLLKVAYGKLKAVIVAHPYIATTTAVLALGNISRQQAIKNYGTSAP